jgi:hypothetical protein
MIILGLDKNENYEKTRESAMIFFTHRKIRDSIFAGLPNDNGNAVFYFRG